MSSLPHKPRSSRSRSPARNERQSHRTRSPHRHHHRHRKSTIKPKALASIELPYSSRQLTKRDYAVFRPMFGLYLDIQKQKDLDEMDEVETRGRWKSFLGKWNRGELAEGWYDPSTLQKAIASVEEFGEGSRDHATIPRRSREDKEPMFEHEPRKEEVEVGREDDDVDLGSNSDDSVGPQLPGQESHSTRGRSGPSIPNMQDLELKREMDAEDGLARRDDIRYERKADRKLQKDALDELVPRAEAGTRERQLEKKKELNEKMKGFREKEIGVEEVPETDLMGGGDSVAELKGIKREFERKKNEREVRREEVLRARQAEREERLVEYQQKEDKTMAMLKQLAKQNFG